MSPVPRPRPAFTLTEMLVVLALIVIIAAISVPALQDLYADYLQDAAADGVRAAWAEARLHAIDEGRPYRFAIVPGMGNFRVAPDGPEFWAGGDSSSSPSNSPPWMMQDALPRGIRFADPSGLGGGAATGDTALPPDAVGLEQWMPVVNFMPDGTASQDVEIVFESRNALPLQLKLRAMTGSVTAVRLRPDGSPR